MPISPEFTSVFSKDWDINFLQCYPNGYLKQTELCNLLQLTAGAHSEMGGMSFSDMQEHDQAWVLSRMRVEIDSLPKWKDRVTIQTWIINLEGPRSVRALEVLLNGEKIAGAVTYWAVFNTALRKPEALVLPHSHFEKYPERLATSSTFTKIELDRNFTETYSRQVVLSDLDIVFHANNVKYLEWCLDYIDYRPLLAQKLKSFEMNFLRELQLNDDISIHKGQNDNQEFFTVKKEGKPCFALELNWV